MTSQNNTLTSERWSALIVTMLLVSVLLMTALILLQRIVPYAKSVRSMHEASLAYYLARGQVDLARYNFLYGGNPIASLRFPSLFWLLSQTWEYYNYPTTSGSTTGRNNGSSGCVTVTDGTNTSDDDCATYHTDEKEYILWNTSWDAYIVVSWSPQNPLQIKLNSTDAEAKQFGTSKANPWYHTLYSRSAGGLRFDLRGVDTNNIGLNTLRLSFRWNVVADITLKMQHHFNPSGDIKTFTRNYTVSGTDFLILNDTVPNGNVQSVDVNGNVTSSTSSFHEFLTEFDNNCAAALLCSLSLILNSPIDQSIDFQLVSGTQIPDLNAVVVGDGTSGNGLYYQRIIDLIGTPQDI